MCDHSNMIWYYRVSAQDLFWDITWLILNIHERGWRVKRNMTWVCINAQRRVSFWFAKPSILPTRTAVNLISLAVHRSLNIIPHHVLSQPLSVCPLFLSLPQDSPSIFTHKSKEAPKERERESENISLIYITRLFQSNIAIHQGGFQWQAITRLPGSSACCLCCCRSLGPQLPNSPWKQYLYIYYIFTQYLPCCKTISYLTINLLIFFFFFYYVSFQSSLPSSLPHLSLYTSPFFSFEWCFFSSCLNFIFFFQKRFFSPFFYLSFRLVYRWNWIFFLLSHRGQSLQ